VEVVDLQEPQTVASLQEEQWPTEEVAEKEERSLHVVDHPVTCWRRSGPAVERWEAVLLVPLPLPHLLVEAWFLASTRPSRPQGRGHYSFYGRRQRRVLALVVVEKEEPKHFGHLHGEADPNAQRIGPWGAGAVS